MSYVQSQIDFQNQYGARDVDKDATFHVDFVCRRLMKEAAFYIPYVAFVAAEGYDGPFTADLNIFTRGVKEDRTGLKYQNPDRKISATEALNLITQNWEIFCNPSGPQMVEYFVNASNAIKLSELFDDKATMSGVVEKMVQIFNCYKLVDIPADGWTLRTLVAWLSAPDNTFMLSLRNVTRFRDLQQWRQLRPLLQDLERELQREAHDCMVERHAGNLLGLFEMYNNPEYLRLMPHPPLPYYITSTIQGGADRLCPPGELFKQPLVRELMVETAKKSGKSPIRATQPMKKLAKLFFATDIHSAYDAEFADMAFEMWKKNQAGKPISLLYNPQFIHAALYKMSQNPRQGVPKSVIAAVVSVAMLGETPQQQRDPVPPEIPAKPLERVQPREESMAKKRGVTFAEPTKEAGGGGGGVRDDNFAGSPGFIPLLLEN